MKGFLFVWGKGLDRSRLEMDRLFGVPTEVVIDKQLDNRYSLLTWGQGPGDVYISNNPAQSLLIWNGYICEADFLKPSDADQSIYDTMRQWLDHHHDIDDLMRAAREIYGSFSAVYVNFAENTIYCMTDRNDSRPIWKMKTSDGFVLSSHSVVLARAMNHTSLEIGALGAFLLYAQPVHPQKCLFKDIQSVPEGSVEVESTDRQCQTHRWYQFHHKAQDQYSPSDWAERVGERLIQAAKRILNDSPSPVVFLSGGLDSRLAAATLKAAGGDPLLVTLGDSENLEIQVARKAAAALQCRHEVILRDADWYLRAFANALITSNACNSLTHSHFSQALHQCREQFGTRAAVLGDCCEAFNKLFCVVDDSRKTLWSEQEFLDAYDTLPLPSYRPAHRQRTLSLLTPSARTVAEQQLQQDIITRYREARQVSTDPKIVLDYFYRWQSAKLLSASFMMLLDVRLEVCERNLMFDRGVREMMESLPSNMRERSHFGPRLICKLWPQAAGVVNSNTLLPLSYPRIAHAAAKFMRPKVGKIRRILFGSSYKTTESWSYAALMYKDNPNWRRFLDYVFMEGQHFPEEIFDIDAVRQAWQRFCGGELDYCSNIQVLMLIGGLGCRPKELVELTKC